MLLQHPSIRHESKLEVSLIPSPSTPSDKGRASATIDGPTLNHFFFTPLYKIYAPLPENTVEILARVVVMIQSTCFQTHVHVRTSPPAPSRLLEKTARIRPFKNVLTIVLSISKVKICTNNKEKYVPYTYFLLLRTHSFRLHGMNQLGAILHNWATFSSSIG